MAHLRQKQAATIERLVLITGLVTTLIIWSSLADPINLPKMFVLIILAAWLIGTLITEMWPARREGFSLGQWAILAFVLGTLVAAFLSHVKYTAFFGSIQRNDGAFSYFALAVLTFASMMSFTSATVGKIRTSMLVMGLVLTLHGLLQTTGHDPFKWGSLLYNPVIGTLGNPDFYSAIVAATGIATFWFILVEKTRWKQGGALALLLLELFVLKRSGSFQGIAAFAAGFSILAVVRIWQYQKRLGFIACCVVGLGSIPVFMGLVNKGPLASHIYRSSIRNRIDYWHAALNMFKAHPFSGVGLDRFGDNYGQFAPQIQVVQGQVTNNAHNVFLQLLATGGLLVILPYLFLLAVIFIEAIRGIKKTQGRTQLDLVAIFSVWFALLLVSLVSIDNLGVAVWFWITGGALYGVARHREIVSPKSDRKSKSGKSKRQDHQDNLNVVSPLVSLIIAIVALLFFVPSLRSSALLFDLERYGGGGLTQAQFANKIHQAANAQPGDIEVRAELSNIALHTSAIDLSLQLTKSINAQDPKSVNGNYLGAAAYEALTKYQSAIPFRVKLLTIDRWNTPNMLQLVKDYIQVKDMTSARTLAQELSRLYPGNADALAATALVKG